jgi:hypothetical protein
MRIVRKYLDYVKRIENPLCNKLKAPTDTPYFGICLIYLSLVGAATMVLLLEFAVWHLYNKRFAAVIV